MVLGSTEGQPSTNLNTLYGTRNQIGFRESALTAICMRSTNGCLDNLYLHGTGEEAWVMQKESSQGRLNLFI